MKKIFIILIIILVVFSSGCDLNRCKQKVEGIGFCEMIHTGYYYDSSVGKCVQTSVSGCSVKSPFSSLEECRKVCEK